MFATRQALYDSFNSNFRLLTGIALILAVGVVNALVTIGAMQKNFTILHSHVGVIDDNFEEMKQQQQDIKQDIKLLLQVLVSGGPAEAPAEAPTYGQC